MSLLHYYFAIIFILLINDLISNEMNATKMTDSNRKIVNVI